MRPSPVICSAGTSEGAKELATKHSDYYLVLAECPEPVTRNIADVRDRAAKYRRADQIRFGVSVDLGEPRTYGFTLTTRF